MRNKKLKKFIIGIMTMSMVFSVASVTTFAAGETLTPHKYVVGDWTTAGGYGSAVAGENGSFVLKGGANNTDGYPVGPYSKAGNQTFPEGGGVIVQEVNVLINPAAEASAVDNGYKFVLSCALNDGSGDRRTEMSYGIQKSGDAVVVDGHGITMDKKDVYTFRIENTKDADGAVWVQLKVLLRGTLVGETTKAKMSEIDGSGSDHNNATVHRYLWFSTINVTDGVKVYTDVPAYTIALDKNTLDLKPTDKAKLTATVGPAFLEDKTVEWSSSDGHIATVDDEGNVTAVSSGKATITAHFNDETAECVVTVAKVENSPKTGDMTTLLIPLILMGGAVLTTGAVIVRRKKA